MKQPALTGIHGKEQLQKHLFRTAASCEVKVAFLAEAIQNPIAVLRPLYLEPELFQNHPQGKLPFQQEMATLKIVMVPEPVKFFRLLAIRQKGLPQLHFVLRMKGIQALAGAGFRRPGEIGEHASLCGDQNPAVTDKLLMPP